MGAERPGAAGAVGESAFRCEPAAEQPAGRAWQPAAAYRVGICCRAGLLVAGGMSAGLGLAVLIALATGRVPLAQVLPASVPMPPAAALGFLLCGAGLIGVGLWFPVAATAAAMVALALALVLAGESLLGAGGRFEHVLAARFACGGAVAPNTAVAFLLAAAAMLLRHGPARLRNRYAGVAALGAVVFAIGATACFGYLAGAPLYMWTVAAPMSFLSSAGCAVLGVGVVMTAWRYGECGRWGAPRWIPEALCAGGLAAGVAVALAAAAAGPLWNGRDGVLPISALLACAALSVPAYRAAWRRGRAPRSTAPGGTALEAMLAEFFAASGQPACLVGFDGTVRVSNALWDREWGAAPGAALADLLHPGDGGRLEGALQQLRMGRQTVAFEARRPTGGRAGIVFRAHSWGAAVTVSPAAGSRPAAAAGGGVFQ